jgi:protocatechuate 3,4-dioxygenase beta subunit
MAKPAHLALGVAVVLVGGLAFWMLGPGGGSGGDGGAGTRSARPDAGGLPGEGGKGGAKPAPDRPRPTGTLRAVITGAGKPIAALLDYSPSPDPENPIAAVYTALAATGVVEVPDATAGVKLKVSIFSPGWRTVLLEDVVVDVGQVKDLGTIDLEKALPATGRVLDPTGKPVAGATVGAASSESVPRFDLRRLAEMFLSEPDWKGKATTDKDGVFSLDSLGAGTWRLVATAPGFAPSDEEEVLLHPAGTAPAVSLVLQTGHPLLVKVTGPGGAPVAGAEVGVAQQSGRGPPTGGIGSAHGVTDAAGEARLSGISGGRQAVAVRASENRLAVRTVEVPRAAEIAVRLEGTAALLVRVRDQSGNPVPDADLAAVVLAGAMENGETFRGKTGAEGTAKWEGLAPGRLLVVTAEKDGFAPQVPDMMQMGQGGEEIKEGQTLEKEVVLKAGATVSGVVRRRPGESPVAGARVAVSSGIALFGGETKTAVSDAEGVYRITGLAEGKATLTAEAPGLVSPEAWAGGGNPFMPRPDGQVAAEGAVDVPAGPAEVKKDLYVEETGTVSGKVLGPSGEGLGGARVEIAAAGGFSFRGIIPGAGGNDLAPEPVLTGPDGSFEVKDVPAGKDLQAKASAPNLLGATSSNFTLASGGSVTGVEVRLTEGAVVAGRITGPSAAPVAGARVRANSRPAGRGGPMNFDPSSFRRLEATTDADGQYRIANVPPGTGSITVTAESFVDGNRGDLAFAAGTETRADLSLEAGRAIAGVVLDAAGAPVEGVRVSAFAPAQAIPGRGAAGPARPSMGGGERFLPGKTGVTDAKGAFRLDGLASGSYSVSASAQGLAPKTIENVAAGTESVELRLQPAVRITGKVVDGEGSPVRGARVSATSEGSESTSVSARSGADGTFTLEGLTAGTYRVAAQTFDRRFARAEVRGVAGDASGLVLTLPKAMEIRGRVTGPDGGAPAAVGFIIPTDAGGLAVSPVRWEQDGSFVAGGLSEGTWTLTARVPGRFEGSVSAKAGQEGIEIRLAAIPAAPDSGGGSPSPNR